MDDLDRLVRRLVQNVRNSHPQYLSQPVEVSELYQTLIPYRHNRTELEIETNQDYEAALCQLLSGERGYVTGDAPMQEAMRKELSSPNPNTAVFRDFAAARVTLTSEAVRHFADSPTSLQRGAPSAISARVHANVLEREQRRERVPLLRRHASRRTKSALLPELRAESHGAALSRVRNGARDSLEVLHHVRPRSRRHVMRAAQRSGLRSCRTHSRSSPAMGSDRRSSAKRSRCSTPWKRCTIRASRSRCFRGAPSTI